MQFAQSALPVKRSNLSRARSSEVSLFATVGWNTIKIQVASVQYVFTSRCAKVRAHLPEPETLAQPFRTCDFLGLPDMRAKRVIDWHSQLSA